MEAVRNILKAKSGAGFAGRDREHAAAKYEPLYESQHIEHARECLCKHCESLHEGSLGSTRMRVAVQVLGGLLLLATWTGLVGYVARNPHLLHLHRHGGPRNLVDQFPNVMTDFRSVPGFVDTDPFDSAFWNPDHAKDDDMLANAWNYYGNSWIWLKKGSPYEVPGGRLLIPLYEKDAWMKDYLGYLSAYQHEIHCVGVIKHALDQCGNGNVSDATLKHANTHCLEVVRHSVMCQPDLKLDVPYYDSHGVQHDPYWGNGKHMCRDPKKVHEFLASRNMGFKVVRENGVDVLKAWAWPLPTDVAIDAAL